MEKKMTHKEHTLAFGAPEKDLHFTPEEYRSRLTRIRKEMAVKNIDMLYVTQPDNLCYISGYRAEWYQEKGPHAWKGLSGIAIHVDHDNYIHFEGEDEKLMAQSTTVSDDLRIVGHEDPHGMEIFVADNLESEGWLKGTVGIEMYSHRPNRLDSEAFQKTLEAKGAKIVDGSDITLSVRKLKSPAEIECAREAARIGDIGFKAALNVIKPGVSELDVFAEIMYAMLKAGGDIPAIQLPVVAGKKNACFHALSSKREIKPGDLVNIDICGVYKKYHSDVTRMVSMGTPDPEVAEYIGHVTGALDIAKGILKPNLPVSEFLDVMTKYYKSNGLWENQWWIGGYELGISFPPDWVGAYYFDVDTDPGDDTFEPGLVTNYEANFYLPKGAGLSCFIDTMAVTEDKVEFMHTIPAELIIIE
ncbi:MAG: Xaa-Pro peptidase family protein [Desulfobacterales bacterium]|nr:Xaa-Pro peptidase family protein [Desulfobacterales bacterium]